jgi:esterase/lipase superfamily enzyme
LTVRGVVSLAPKEYFIYFATNRRVRAIDAEHKQFAFLSSQTPTITYGFCDVSLPGRADEQSWWNLDRAIILSTRGLQEDQFVGRLFTATSKDVLVFIHGFDNTFEDAIVQGARMKRDLMFKGATVVFSWPSAGSIHYYSQDEDMATKSMTAASAVLEKLVERARQQGGKVFVVAHSMGNRILIDALRVLYLKHRKELSDPDPTKRVLAMVAFAAADVDKDFFAAVMRNVPAIAANVTFYYSTKDRALKLSDRLIGHLNRAGLVPIFSNGVATVNADRTSRWSSIGHSYYTSSDSVILDLLLQVKWALPPERRAPQPLELDNLRTEKPAHWLLVP